MIFLAPGPELQQLAQTPVLKDLFRQWKHRVIPVPVRNGQGHAFFSAQSHNFIGLSWGPYKRFFNVDPADACADGGDDPSVVLVDVPGADRNQFRAHGFQKRVGIGKCPNRAESGLGGCETFWVRIRHSYDCSGGESQPCRVEAVSEVAASCVAEDSDAQRRIRGGCGQQGQEFEEGSAGHARCGGERCLWGSVGGA